MLAEIAVVKVKRLRSTIELKATEDLKNDKDEALEEDLDDLAFVKSLTPDKYLTDTYLSFLYIKYGMDA